MKMMNDMKLSQVWDFFANAHNGPYGVQSVYMGHQCRPADLKVCLMSDVLMIR